MKKCKKCGNQKLVKNRKLCKNCNLERVKKYYKPRKYSLQCQACKQKFNGWRKTSILCPKCWKEKINLSQQTIAKNNYKYDTKGKPIHRIIAESLLGKLPYNQVVHHLDHNSKNNDLTNLIVMSRKTHGQLHKFLDYQRVILEQSNNENGVNCWNNLIVPITTAWLETTNAKVQKLWEIGQSAAKPLLTEEGSETKHSTSQAEDDIVQTTTI